MKRLIIAVCLLLALSSLAQATQTENNGIRILPAPGPVTVDGKANDWDLSGGIFICDSVETQRDQYAVWLHTMYDAKGLYILAHFLDQTPLNNPGQTIADYGFAGDCLQMRLIVAPGTPNERTTHLTAWQGRDGRDVMDVVYGKQFNEGSLKDAKTQGGQQAFQKDADGRGYIQEIFLPWALLTKNGQVPHAGDRMTMTAEPNFTVGASGRMSIKDIFKPGVTPDRVFTFMGSDRWGPATFEAKGAVAPQPVRLSDAREFPVKLQGGALVVDWTGLVKSKDLPGFKTIKFTMPQDGYISLHIKNADGQVVRQLLNAAFYAKGDHEVKWDGLTTPNWNVPGQPVPPGNYTWSALYHTGIGLKLRGWAGNAGSAPWDSGPTTNWGGDEGPPAYAAANGDGVYLGWSGAEAGKALLAVDSQGAVKWKNNRQGMAGASLVAATDSAVYAVNWGEKNTNYLYRLDAKTGAYTTWGTSNSPDLFPHDLWAKLQPGVTGQPDHIDGLAAYAQTVLLSFTKADAIILVNDSTGTPLKLAKVPAPGFMCPANSGPVKDSRLHTPLYVVSGGTRVLVVNPWLNEVKTVIDGLSNATGIALDKAGDIYVGVGDPDNQVKVFSVAGKLLRTIGRPGGRALLGPWTPDGMRFISGITIDSAGKLWVAESDTFPRRVSVWDAQSGQFVKEFLGPSDYGALGSVIDPLDPNLMVGQGCEWRLDPQTGKATCLGVITRDGMANSRFGVGTNGKLYLAVASKWTFELGPVNIYERVGDGNYKLRAQFSYEGKDKDTQTSYWADANGDGQRQPNEVTTVPGTLRFSAWYMAMAPDLTLSAGDNLLKVIGFTPAGAPLYDLAHSIKMPTAGTASADRKVVLHGGDYAADHSWFTAYDLASGKVAWTYPDTFVGVHGSHNAPPSEDGLIRGSYGPTGVAQLPAPIGGVFVVPTNVSEWHILTEDGFYLTRLFQPDPLKVKFPEQAVPGADMSDAPPGMGGEDFGGSVTLGKDGKLYLQAGKTAFWNMEVTGLNTVRALGPDNGTAIQINDADVRTAQNFHDQLAQAVVGKRRMTVSRMSPTFTGNLDNDFKGAEIINYQKSDDAAARSAAAWDDTNLYLAWDVKDNTPWVNAATDATQMYIGGDTVDFQMSTNPTADKNRGEATLGDLRLSIGNFRGRETAVLYRRVAGAKKPRVFSSGVVKNYPMDFVDVLTDAKITVNKRGDGYTVEAAIPVRELDFKPREGLALQGDFGVTRGDPAGQRTRLRTYWNNQHTGIVDDAVYELMMEPKNWGELLFK